MKRTLGKHLRVAKVKEVNQILPNLTGRKNIPRVPLVILQVRRGLSFDITGKQKMGKPTILVAIDFSKESEAALLWAVDHATRANAQLAIIHAIHDPADAPGFYKRKHKDQLRPTSEVAQDLLDEFLIDFAKTRPNNDALKTAKIILVKGLPAKRILAVATELGVDHIVMGCFGHRHLSNILMGSVAQQVVRKTPLPVTLVKRETN